MNERNKMPISNWNDYDSGSDSDPDLIAERFARVYSAEFEENEKKEVIFRPLRSASVFFTPAPQENVVTIDALATYFCTAPENTFICQISRLLSAWIDGISEAVVSKHLPQNRTFDLSVGQLDTRKQLDDLIAALNHRNAPDGLIFICLGACGSKITLSQGHDYSHLDLGVQRPVTPLYIENQPLIVPEMNRKNVEARDKINAEIENKANDESKRNSRVCLVS